MSEAAATAGIRNPLNGLKRPKIHGAMLLCPMLEIAPVSPQAQIEPNRRCLTEVIYHARNHGLRGLLNILLEE